MGTPAPIYNFTTQFDGSLALIWADGTNGTGNPSASAIMTHITSGFNEFQLSAVKQVASTADIPSNCPQNFNLISECYAAIAFNYLPLSPTDTTPIDYTISADGGLIYVNVYSHTSDFETRILPLQLAIDEVVLGAHNIPLGVEFIIPVIYRSQSRAVNPNPFGMAIYARDQPATSDKYEIESVFASLSAVFVVIFSFLSGYIRGIRNLLVIALYVSTICVFV